MRTTNYKNFSLILFVMFSLLIIPSSFAAGNISVAEMAITFESVNTTHALDVSGNGHHLLLNTGTPRYVSGVILNASNTSGAQNLVPYIWNNENTFCFSTKGKDSTQTVLDISGSGALQYQFYGDPGYELALYQELSSGDYLYGEVANTPFDGSFHDYCVVYDGGTDTSAMTVYIDGVLQTLTGVDEQTPFVFDGSPFDGSNFYRIGAPTDSISNFYDQIYQYDVALNASQVLSIHNNHTADCGYPFQCASEEEEPEPEPEPENDNSDVERSLSVMSLIIGIGLLVSVMGAILTFTNNKDALTYFGYVIIAVIVLVVILIMSVF